VCFVLPEVDVDYSISRKGIRESFRQPRLLTRSRKRDEWTVEYSFLGAFRLKHVHFLGAFRLRNVDIAVGVNKLTMRHAPKR
jgi:hypothetical protein